MPKSRVASTYLALTVHLVFATKGRYPFIDKTWREDLHGYMGGALRGLGATAVTIGGVEDHVHILAGIRATHAIADLVRELKKSSHEFAISHQPQFNWQTGYAAIAVGPNELQDVARYVRNQDEHHKSISSADELKALLQEAGIDYDPRYFE